MDIGINKMRILFKCLLVGLVLVLPISSYGLDYPHSGLVNSIGCGNCHFVHSGGPGLLPGWAYHTPTNIDDTATKALCDSCHTGTGGQPPRAEPHSSLTTDNGYGDWSIDCKTCHDPHQQRQFRTYGSESYLYSGVSTDVTTTTITQTGAGWTVDQYQGLVVLPNVNEPNYTYKILSNTTDTLTVEGPIDLSKVTAGVDTFAIIYGKLIREVIDAPDMSDPGCGVVGNEFICPTIPQTVKFLRDTPPNSFADGASPYDGVCEVCHTQTSHHRRDDSGGDHTHNVGTKCTQCHLHTAGFKGGDCNSCHGGSGSTGAPLLQPDDLVGVQDTNYPTTGHTVGAHSKHVVDNSYTDCTICHLGHGMPTIDQVITIAYSGLATANSSTPSYDGTTLNAPYTYAGDVTGPTTGTQDCSSVYCHSNVQGQIDGTGSPTSYGTPDWGNASSVQCGSCHKADGAQGDLSLMDSGTHTTHVNASTYSKPCSTCHSGAGSGSSVHVNNSINVTIDATYGGTYDGDGTGDDSPGKGYGGCSNVYCHSDAQSTPTYADPTWGSTLPTDCTGCHNNNVASASAMASGSHTTHINDSDNEVGRNLGCIDCHADTVSDDRTISNYTNHVNKVKDIKVNIDGTTCSNIKCHSDGNFDGTVTYNNPTWGVDTLGCVNCHGDGATKAYPSYADGNAGTGDSNSHNAHIGQGYNCIECHKDTSTAGTSIDGTVPSKHVNQTVDVVFNQGGTYTDATETCSATFCHGSGTPQWGGTVNCEDCHLGTGDTDDYTYDNGTLATLDSTQWTGSGHGKTTGTYTSGNSAANLSCEYCHDETVAHGTSTNPFRLANYNVGGNGWNDTCYVCHKTGSTGYDPDGGGPLTSKNATVKIDKYHSGSKHGASNDGGSLCFDCHDPHGDSNIYMVHDTVTKDKADSYGTPNTTGSPVFTANATGTDYAKSSAPFNGVCNVCHTTTNHYTSTSGDGHNSGTKCVQCHDHSGDTTVDGNAFTPSGDNCSDCHSSAGGPTAGTTPDTSHGYHIQTAYVGSVSAGDYGNYTTNNWYGYTNTGGTPDMKCGYCHPQSDATHMNGTINLNFAYNDTGASGTLKAKNDTTESYSQTERTSVTCSSVYCHSDGYSTDGTGNAGTYGYQTSPEWYAGNFVGDKCDDCHGNSPSSNAHSTHVVGIHYKDIYDKSGTGLLPEGDATNGGHGDTYSTVINCNVCHNSTVSVSYNDQNSVCSTCHDGTTATLQGDMVIDPSSTTHVSGTPDVSFAGVTLRSKAQIRDNITTITELNTYWIRNNGYKAAANSYDSSKSTLGSTASFSSGTCSTVACHNGYSVDWNSTTVSCNSCHKELPN